MVMFSLTQPPWYSRTENNLNIFISEFSYFNNKLPSLDKLYILRDFSSSTLRNLQRAISSKHSLLPRWNISSHSLTTTENLLSTQEGTFMESIVTYRLLDIQKHLPLQFNAFIILVLNIPSTIIQELSRQLLQISALYRRLFANSVEVLDTMLMPASSVGLNSSH